MKYSFEASIQTTTNSYAIPADKAETWQRQMGYRFTLTTSKEKRSDIEITKKFWLLLGR